MDEAVTPIIMEGSKFDIYLNVMIISITLLPSQTLLLFKDPAMHICKVYFYNQTVVKGSEGGLAQAMMSMFNLFGVMIGILCGLCL